MRARIALPFAAVVLIVLDAAAPAQPLEFEVASIKVNRNESGGSSISFQNGNVTFINASLLTLLRSAYDLGSPRILGPSWLDSDRFDVLAKSQAGVPQSDLMAMLQNLLKLKNSFRISLHWDKKEMPVYEMTVARDGLKIAPFDPAHPQLEMKPGGGAMSMVGVASMEGLAKSLSGPAGRPVIDKTGVEGQYIYRLSYTSLSTQSESAPDPAPDFFAAVEQQLGLKLEPKRAAVEVLVIDRAERIPIEN